MSDLQFDPKKAGAALAEADDGEQAEFLNEFGRWLQLVCRKKYMAETQILRLIDRLDGCGAWIVDEMKSYLDHRREVEEQKRRLAPRED